MPLSCVKKTRSLLAKDAIQPAPPAEMESGLYKGPYFIVPKKHGGLHPIWDLRVSEPGPCQAPVQDVDAETPLSMRPSLRLCCSDRPERRLLPCSRSSLDSALHTKGEPTSRPSPSGTSAGWGFRSTGKRANSPLCRGSLFSAWSWTRSTSQHVSQRSVLSQC